MNILNLMSHIRIKSELPSNNLTSQHRYSKLKISFKLDIN